MSKKPFASQIALRLFIDSQASEAHLNGQMTKRQVTQLGHLLKREENVRFETNFAFFSIKRLSLRVILKRPNKKALAMYDEAPNR